MKKRTLLRVLAAALCVALLLVYLPIAGKVEASAISNLLDSYTLGTGSFTLRSTGRFFISTTTKPSTALVDMVQLSASEYAAAKMPSATALSIVWGHEDGAQPGDIIIRLDSSYASEAYRLETTTDNAIVTAGDSAGVRYGLNLLLKHTRLSDSATIPVFVATDCPDVAERILRLDCGRKYFTKNWIINLIREMSWMGYNQLELHFSDDGGLRLDIWDSNYFISANGNDYSWICGSQPAYWVECTDPDQGKYLTAAEMVQILSVAKQYGIEVVPSFNTPGHSEYMTRRFEDYTTSSGQFTFKYGGNTYTSGTTIHHNGGSDTKYGCIALNNDNARAFVLSMIEDYADFFKIYGNSDAFHVGADEIVFSNSTYNFVEGWDTYAKNKGFGTTAYDTYYQYLNTVDDLLNSKGFETRAFNDFLELSGMTHSVELNSDIAITYWSTDSNSHGMPSAQTFANQGRKLYNGIQSYCYYVLRTRNGLDARDPSHDSWEFTKATAQNIWAWWDPALFAQYGDTNIWVDMKKVSGAYYMIWCDYAGLETEQNMWYGNHWDVDGYGGYGLRPRMWASICKMWKQNADNGMTYDQFFNLHSTLADYPGYAGPTATVTLPAAPEPVRVYRADHSELAQLLATKISPEGYTPESYTVYDQRYAEAMALDGNIDASAQELADAASALQAAIEALEFQRVDVTVVHKTLGTGRVLFTETQQVDCYSPFRIPVHGYSNYEFSYVEGATFEFTDYGADIGSLTGVVDAAAQIVVWYESKPDLSAFRNALAAAPRDQGSFTDASWAIYQPVLAEALSFQTDGAYQEQVDDITTRLEQAVAALATGAQSAEIYFAALNTAYVTPGRQAVVRLLTSTDVDTITVSLGGEAVAVNRVASGSDTNVSGDPAKIWLVYFTVEESGDYTIQAASGDRQTSVTLEIPCQ